MKTVIVILAVAILSPLFIYTSCEKKNDSRKCDGVMCTAMFAMITVHIVDTDNQPVALDSAYTLRTETGEKIIHNVNTIPENTYTVLDDGYQKNLAQSSATFRFVGFKNGKEIVNEPYTISADCCHINKQSGSSTITVTK